MLIELYCNGQVYQGWTSFSVKQSMEAATGGMSLTSTDAEAVGISTWNVQGGSEVNLRVDGIDLFNGYVTKYEVGIGESEHSISIEAASKAIDAVECSHKGPYFWKSNSKWDIDGSPITAPKIIEQVLRPFGINSMVFGDMKPIAKDGFRVEVDKSPFDIVKDLAALSGMTVYSDGSGILIISNSGEGRSDAGIIGRGRYASLNVSHDMSVAYSEVIIKAQENDKDGDETKARFNDRQRKELTAVNSAGIRYRPIISVEDGTKEQQETFAEYVRDRLVGDAITVTATVKSLKNPNGSAWQLGQYCYIDEPLVDVRRKLIVSEAEFSLDDSIGFSVNLTFKPAQVFDNTSASPRETRLEDAFDQAFGNWKP